MRKYIKSKILAACFLTFATAPLLAQQTKTGTVKDNSGKPIQQARIEAGKSKFPIISNKKGQFVIEDEAIDSIFIFKKGYVQYKEAMIKITDLNSIVLQTETKFDQILVLPYGANINKKYYAGAASSLMGDDLVKFRTINNTNALAGQVAGLITTQFSDEPGGGSALNIRGVSSYNNNSVNTYVDNVPLSLSQIDPLEIEEVTILKDATANSRYGIEGANKSIFVTTKRGKAYENKINFYSHFGIVKPTGKQNFLGAQSYMQLYNEAAVNDGLPVRFSSAQIDAYNNPNRNMDIYPDVDWYDALVKDKALQQKYNLSFSGGNKLVRYFVLMGYTKQGGLFKFGDFNEAKYGFTSNADFDRYNFRANIDFAITKTLTGSVDLGGRLENQKSPGDLNLVNNVWTAISRYPTALFPITYSDGKIGGNSQFSRSPYGLLTQNGYTLNAGRNLLGTTKLTQNLDALVKGLSATGAFSYYNNFTSLEGRTMDFATYELLPDGKTFQKFGNDVPYATRGRGNFQERSTTVWAKADYVKTFGTAHELNASIGFNQSVLTPVGDDYPYVSQGFFSRIFYNYNKKYIAEFNAGYNGNENLPKGKRYGFFPSLALAWIVSNEDFAKNDNIDLLKLRTSYGLLGNAEFGLGGLLRARYLYLGNEKYEAGSGYTFGATPGGVTGRREGSFGNSDVTWETNYIANMGIDAEFFNHTFGGSIDAFMERRVDILAPYNISSLGGYTIKPSNFGEVTNKGIEWDIYYQNKIGDFAFSVHALGSFIKNKVVDQNELTQSYDYLYRKGNPVGTPFGLEAIGFFKDQNEINSSPTQTFGPVQPGDIRYKDLNADGIINIADQAKIGSPSLPQFYYGSTLSLSYKNIDFSALIQGAASRTVDISNLATQGFSNNNKPNDFILNRWTPATAATADYPRLSLGTNSNNLQSSTFWKRNGNYLRLKTIEIGYNLPYSLVSKVKLAKVRLFANGYNLFTISDLPVNLDPEFLDAGLGGYPHTKSFNFGLNVEF